MTTARRPRLVVMVSGSGSNLQALLDATEAGTLAADIVRVVSNREGVRALERARAHGVAMSVHTLRAERAAGGNRETFDAKLADFVAAASPDLVVLAGFMHVLSPVFLDRFGPRAVVNLHPALLPSNAADDVVTMPDGRCSAVFRGHDAVAQALAAGVSWTGTTVHYVTADVDRGDVLASVPVPIEAGDDVATLQARIQRAEHVLLPQTLTRLLTEVPRTEG